MTRSSFVVQVDGSPKGQPRPRAFARHGKARVYDPGTAEGWKAQVALALRPHVPEQPHAGPVRVSLAFTFARPAAHLRKHGDVRPTAPQAHTTRPDADNLAKAVLDACTTIGLWRDDAQVVGLVVRKDWGNRGGCEIGVTHETYEPTTTREVE